MWANNAVIDVPRASFSNGTATYESTDYLGIRIVSASAQIYAEWGGQFVLMEGACSPTPAPTEIGPPEQNPTDTPAATTPESTATGTPDTGSSGPTNTPVQPESTQTPNITQTIIPDPGQSTATPTYEVGDVSTQTASPGSGAGSTQTAVAEATRSAGALIGNGSASSDPMPELLPVTGGQISLSYEIVLTAIGLATLMLGLMLRTFAQRKHEKKNIHL